MKQRPLLRLAVALALVIASTCLASGADAQRINTIRPTSPKSVTIDGIISDGLGRPLAAAEVIVDDEHRAISNARGEFSISGLPAGIVEFIARRIGYQPMNSAIQIDPGVTVHLAIKLVPLATQLGTIVIEGKRMDRALWNTGFYQRRDRGTGHYFDAEYMKRFNTSLGGLLENVASVRVERGPSHQGGRGGPVPMGRLANGNLCPLNVFVDGNHIPWASMTGIDDVISRDDVLAMEVYPRASEMPATIVGRGGASGGMGSFNLQGATVHSGGGFVECGAILIWTKPFEEKQ